MLKLLRKLGILRYGTKSYKYTSGKDMPARALMDDVYDEDKDLVNKQDVEKVRQAVKTSRGKSTIKWILIGIIGFLGLCFVLGMLFGTDDSAVQDQAAAQQAGGTQETVATPATSNNSEPSRALTVSDDINLVFSGVRQANFDENIEAFMQFYAGSFPDRSGKKQKTLDTWQKYDFASLDFFVFGLKVEGSRAEASVGWEIALLEKGSSVPRLIETTNEVVLEKGGTGWQIVSLQ